MGPDHAGIDTEDPLDLTDRVVLDDGLGQDLLPRAVHRPFPQPLMGGLPRPVTFRHIAPRGPGAQLEQDRVDHLPVIPPLPTAPGSRK